MSLTEDLYDMMESALMKAPKPKGMSDADYARHVLDAAALNQLQRALKQQEYRRIALETQQAAIANGSRYYICHPYDGLAVDVKPDELKAFADWSGVPHKDLQRMVDGEVADAKDWQPWSVLLRIDSYGNPLVMHQLCKTHIPQAPTTSMLKRFDNFRASVPVVSISRGET